MCNSQKLLWLCKLSALRVKLAFEFNFADCTVRSTRTPLRTREQLQCASACMHEVCGAKKCALLCRVELYRPSYVDQIWLWCLY